MILSTWLSTFLANNNVASSRGRRRRVSRHHGLAVEACEQRILLSATDATSASVEETEIAEEQLNAVEEAFADPLQSEADGEVSNYVQQTAGINEEATLTQPVDNSPIDEYLATWSSEIADAQGTSDTVTADAVTQSQDDSDQALASADVASDEYSDGHLFDSSSGASGYADAYFSDENYGDEYGEDTNDASSGDSSDSSDGSNTDSGSDDSNTGDSTSDDSQPLDPRFDWKAFSFTGDDALNDESLTLPIQSSLDDLFQVQPDGTGSFSTTTVLVDDTTEQPTDAELGTGTKTTTKKGEVTLSQTWDSPDNWTVTQSVTKSFVSDEESTDAEGADDNFGRTGEETFTVTVINGTTTVTTYSVTDTFSYGTGEVADFDDSADPQDWTVPQSLQDTIESQVEDATNASDELTDDTPGSSAGDDQAADADVDESNFGARYMSTSGYTVTVTETQITLPDGSLGTTVSLSISSISSFISVSEGGYDFASQEGETDVDAEFPGQDTDQEDDLPIIVRQSTDGSQEDQAEDEIEGENGHDISADGNFGLFAAGGNNLSFGISATVDADGNVSNVQPSLGLGTNSNSGGSVSQSLSARVQTASETGSSDFVIKSNSGSGNNSNFNFSIDVGNEVDAEADFVRYAGDTGDGTSGSGTDGGPGVGINLSFGDGGFDESNAQIQSSSVRRHSDATSNSVTTEKTTLNSTTSTAFGISFGDGELSLTNSYITDNQIKSDSRTQLIGDYGPNTLIEITEWNTFESLEKITDSTTFSISDDGIADENALDVEVNSKREVGRDQILPSHRLTITQTTNANLAGDGESGLDGSITDTYRSETQTTQPDGSLGKVIYTNTNTTGLGNSAERSLDDILSEYRARATNIARWEAARAAALSSGDQAMADHFQSLITREESTLNDVRAAALAAGATDARLDTIRGEANATATDNPIDVQPWNGGEWVVDNRLGGALVGAGQGVLNTVNGVQDALVTIVNVAPVVVTFGMGTMWEIHSPDWSRGRLVEDETYHDLSKFLGGQGLLTLLTLGASQLGNAARLGHLTTVEGASGIASSSTINGSGGVYATSAAAGTFRALVARVITFGGTRVPVPATAAGAFGPIPVVGPVSFMNRFLAGGYVSYSSSVNLVTGATTALPASGYTAPVLDAVLYWLTQYAAQESSGTIDTVEGI